MIAKAMSRASKKIAEKTVLARGFSADFFADRANARVFRDVSHP